MFSSIENINSFGENMRVLCSFLEQFKLVQSLERKLTAKRDAAVAFSNEACPPILIYTMGKVGSSTVYKSLVEASILNPVLHLHFLSENLPRHLKLHKEAGVWPLPEHLYLGAAIRRVLLKHKDFPVKIISLVRDPLSFIISNLFENPSFAGESIISNTGLIDPQKATDYINERLSAPNAFGYVYNWFDKELKTVFGIDVFAHPFPVDKGYITLHHSNVDALVLRLEDLSDKGPQVITDFLGLPETLVLREDNVRADSNGKDPYLQVQRGVLLDKDACTELYSSKFVRHFYSDELINKFISRWTTHTPG